MWLLEGTVPTYIIVFQTVTHISKSTHNDSMITSHTSAFSNELSKLLLLITFSSSFSFVSEAAVQSHYTQFLNNPYIFLHRAPRPYQSVQHVYI